MNVPQRKNLTTERSRTNRTSKRMNAHERTRTSAQTNKNLPTDRCLFCSNTLHHSLTQYHNTGERSYSAPLPHKLCAKELVNQTKYLLKIERPSHNKIALLSYNFAQQNMDQG